MIPSALHASTITVNSILDPELGGVPVTSGLSKPVLLGGTGVPTCTLREAINNANTPGIDTTDGDCLPGSGTDTINFSVSGTITLVARLAPIVNNLTIDGSGQTITISGNDLYQAFLVFSGATLNLNDLEIEYCYDNSGVGGAVATSGTLTVSNCYFDSNEAVFGGAISNGTTGNVTVTDSYFGYYGGNSALIDGGAILNNRLDHRHRQLLRLQPG